MSMKLSYRDKVIIIVLAVLVVLGVGIFTFIKPKFADLQASEDRLTAKEAERDDVQSKMETQKQFMSERDYGETYQISKYLMDKLHPAGIEITGISLDRLTSTQLEAYTYNKYAVAYPMKINADIAGKLPPEVGYAYEGGYPAAPASVAVGGTVVTVSYTCTNNDGVFDAIQSVADNEENIYLQSVSASYKDEGKTEDGKIEGDMVIEIYEVYTMDPADIED